MGNGPGGLKLHFLSKEPPVVCTGRRGKGSGGGGSREASGSIEWGLTDVEPGPCLSICQPVQGLDRPQYLSPYSRVLEMGLRSCLPWEKGIDRADLEDGAHSVILGAPTPSVYGWGGWELALGFAGREQYVLTTGAGLRLPNSQPAWGDNI